MLLIHIYWRHWLLWIVDINFINVWKIVKVGTYILCSKSAILVNALLINIVLWKAKSYPLLPFFSGHWPEAKCTKGRDGTHWSLTRLCAYIVHTYTCHHIQHNIWKQVCLFIIFPEGGPLCFFFKSMYVYLRLHVYIYVILLYVHIHSKMFWIYLKRWLCWCFHFMNRNFCPPKGLLKNSSRKNVVKTFTPCCISWDDCMVSRKKSFRLMIFTSKNV